MAQWLRRENDRPLVGYSLGSYYPLRRYPRGAARLPDGPVRPDDVVVADYLDDTDHLFELHERAGAVGGKGRGDDPAAQSRSLRRAQSSFRILDSQAFIGPASAPLYCDSIGFRIGFGSPVIPLPHYKVKVGQKTRSPVDNIKVFLLGTRNNPHAEPLG